LYNPVKCYNIIQYEFSNILCLHIYIKLHYYESASGLKFVVCTDPRTPNLQNMLHQIYRDIYVEYVVKNPLCRSDNDYINNELFKTKLHEFIKSQSN